jgi:hypothetical protein
MTQKTKDRATRTPLKTGGEPSTQKTKDRATRTPLKTGGEPSTQNTKDRATRTPLKTGGEPRCFGKHYTRSIHNISKLNTC